MKTMQTIMKIKLKIKRKIKLKTKLKIKLKSGRFHESWFLYENQWFSWKLLIFTEKSTILRFSFISLPTAVYERPGQSEWSVFESAVFKDFRWKPPVFTKDHLLGMVKPMFLFVCIHHTNQKICKSIRYLKLEYA